MADPILKNGNMYNRFLQLIHDFVVGIRKHLLLFVLCIVSVTSILFFFNYKSSNIYSTSFTVMYEELVKKIYGDRLMKLDILVHKDDISKVTKLLNISEEAASTIVGIKGKNILGEELSKDLNTDKIPFIVELYFTDIAFVQEIQEGIVNFLENGNAYLKDKKEIKIQETEAELEFINKQLAMLDTLKRRYNTMPITKVGNEQLDLGGIYEFSYSLFKKKQQLENKRSMPANLNIVDDVVVPVPNTKAYPFLMIIGFIIGLGIYTILFYFVIPAYKYKDN